MDPSSNRTKARVEDANCRKLGVNQKERLNDFLHRLISGGLFPTDLKRVPGCVDGELSRPLRNKSCAHVAEQQRRFSPPEGFMTTEKIHKLL